VACLQTVVETPAYLAAARGVLSEALRARVVSLVAENPAAGVPLGGGVRRSESRGPEAARAAARAWCFCRPEKTSRFLLTLFAKNEKADLSARERATVIAAAKALAADYRRKP